MFSPERDDRVTGGVGGFGSTENERRIADVVKYGVVKQADYSKSPARLRVGIGDPDDPEGYILTGWLPMKTGRSDEWNPLRVGEAVTVLAEGGELQNAVVLPGAIPNTDNPNVGDRADLWRKRFKDGSVLEYDEAAGAMKLTSKTNFESSVGNASVKMQDGQAVVTVGGATITVTPDSIVLSAGGQSFTVGGGGAESTGRIKGNDGLEVTGTPFTHNGHDVGENHKHTNVQTGSGLSGKPQ